MFKRLAVCLLAVFFNSPVEAASFDCSKATTPNEKLICSDDRLSAADEELNATFNTDLALLSETGQQILRRSQLAWLKYVETLCADVHVHHMPPSPHGTLFNEPLACLQQQYRERQKELSKTVTKNDHFTIVRTDLYETPPSPDTDTRHPGLFDIHHAYPQIDAPQNEAQTAWNEYIKKQILDLESPGEGLVDVSVDYDVSVLGPNMISTTINWFYYAHHAAHGYNSTIIRTWLLDEKRLLKADDLFAENQDWKRKLADICYSELMKKNQEGKHEDKYNHKLFDIKDPTELIDTVSNPGRWTFSPQTLGIQFEQYEVGLYIAGAPKIEIPWEQLRAYLVKSPPVDISEKACLPFEPAQIQLTGQLTPGHGYGPPNFGEDPTHDLKEDFGLLTLDRPVCVSKGTDEIDEDVENIQAFQLVAKTPGIRIDENLFGHRVDVSGTLFHRVGDGHTDVMVLYTDIHPQP